MSTNSKREIIAITRNRYKRAETRRRLNSGTMAGRRFIKHIIPIKSFDYNVTGAVLWLVSLFGALRLLIVIRGGLKFVRC